MSGELIMINKQHDIQIKTWLSDNRDWIIDEWIELAKIPSVQSEPKENMPFGEECARALSAATNLFERKGFSTKIYNNHYALCTHGSGEKTIGIFSHSDVVPVGDDWLYTKPFEPIIKNNTLIGRGVEDNKSGIMAALCVMLMTKELNLPVKSRLQTFIGANEETGMEDIEAFVKEQPMPEVSFIPDAEFPCSIGEKGIFHYWAKNENKLTDILEFNGGLAFNVVLDFVTVKIAYKAELENELIEKIKVSDAYNLTKDGETLVLTAKGVSQHASTPDGSVNAAYLAASILSGCENLANADRQQMEAVAKLTKSGFGEGINLIHDDSKFGKLTMANGIVKVENGYLSLSFDTRYGSEISGEEVEKRTTDEMKKLGFTIEITKNSPGFYIPEESPVAQALNNVYNEITGKDVKPILMGGGTYARHLKNAFSLGTCEGCPNGFEMPAGHGGAHQCDEKIDIDGFFEAVRILMHFILQYEEI